MLDKHECTKEPVFTKIFVKLSEATKDISYIKKSIDGNGEPGLLKKASEAHDYIIEQKAKGKIETWSRKKLILVLGIIYVTLQIIELLVKKHLGGG